MNHSFFLITDIKLQSWPLGSKALHLLAITHVMSLAYNYLRTGESCIRCFGTLVVYANL
jgi:hypothetical protein